MQKINLKLQGTNHVLENSEYGILDRVPTMVVGIDVTHPPPGAEGTPSVAAVVASCDRYLSQWPVDLRINKSRQEMVAMLREMLMTRLEHYKEKNDKQLPENILIYRDGVGEGQYKIVLEEELPRLRDACRRLYGEDYVEGVRPRISLIVVGKRHHTRFYKTTPTGYILPGRNSNPICGTASIPCAHQRENKSLTVKKGRRQDHYPGLQLGFLPSVAHRNQRDRTSSSLLCPSRRNLQKYD